MDKEILEAIFNEMNEKLGVVAGELGKGRDEKDFHRLTDLTAFIQIMRSFKSSILATYAENDLPAEDINRQYLTACVKCEQVSNIPPGSTCFDCWTAANSSSVTKLN
jgi:hypothetical protein